METELRPNCYKCKHRKPIIGDAHSQCENIHANAKGNRYGIQNGWFFWPLNFDPVWLISCDGFEEK